MFKMSTFSFDACRKSFMKSQNRFVDCFVRQIIPESLHNPLHSEVLVSAYWNLLKLFLLFCFVHNKILCHNDIPTKVSIVTTRITLIKANFCSLAKLILEVCVILAWTNGAKFFTHFWDIAIFMLGHFFLNNIVVAIISHIFNILRSLEGVFLPTPA